MIAIQKFALLYLLSAVAAVAAAAIVERMRKDITKASWRGSGALAALLFQAVAAVGWFLAEIHGHLEARETSSVVAMAVVLTNATAIAASRAGRAPTFAAFFGMLVLALGVAGLFAGPLPLSVAGAVCFIAGGALAGFGASGAATGLLAKLVVSGGLAERRAGRAWHFRSRGVACTLLLAAGVGCIAVANVVVGAWFIPVRSRSALAVAGYAAVVTSFLLFFALALNARRRMVRGSVEGSHLTGSVAAGDGNEWPPPPAKRGP